MKRFLPILFLLLATQAGAQFFNKVNWDNHRHQLEWGAGVTNFLGDLGGKDAIGTNDFQDLEKTEYNFGAYVGYKYAIYQKFYGRLDFTYGKVSGNDQLTGEIFRQNRNLHFKSHVFELALMAEYEIPLNFRKGHIHDIKGVRGWGNGGSSLFVFVGVGAFYFNPKAELEGVWYELQPLRTEGQGLPGGPKKYRRVAVSWPVGASITKRLAPQFSLGIELSYRFTTTDYIDDVSTSYFNPYDVALYHETHPDIAAYFSNPALGASQGGLSNVVTSPGQQRGDETDDDGWMLFSIKCQYLLGEGYKSPRSKFRKYGKTRFKRRK